MRECERLSTSTLGKIPRFEAKSEQKTGRTEHSVLAQSPSCENTADQSDFFRAINPPLPFFFLCVSLSLPPSPPAFCNRTPPSSEYGELRVEIRWNSGYNRSGRHVLRSNGSIIATVLPSALHVRSDSLCRNLPSWHLRKRFVHRPEKSLPRRFFAHIFSLSSLSLLTTPTPLTAKNPWSAGHRRFKQMCFMRFRRPESLVVLAREPSRSLPVGRSIVRPARLVPDSQESLCERLPCQLLR